MFKNQGHSFYSKDSEIGFFGLKPKDTNDNVRKLDSSLVAQIKT
jgi:hypothetical protein